MSFDFPQIEKVKRVYLKIKLNKHNFKLRFTPTGYSESELKLMHTEELIDLKASIMKYIVKNNPVIKNTTLFGLIDRIEKELQVRSPMKDSLSLNESNRTYQSLSTNPTLASLQSKYSTYIQKKGRNRKENEREFLHSIDQPDYATVNTTLEEGYKRVRIKKFTKRKLKISNLDRFSLTPLKVPNCLHDMQDRSNDGFSTFDKTAFPAFSSKPLNSKYGRSMSSINNINDFELLIRKQSNSSCNSNIHIFPQTIQINKSSAIAQKSKCKKNYKDISPCFWSSDDEENFSFNMNTNNEGANYESNIYSAKHWKQSFSSSTEKYNITSPRSPNFLRIKRLNLNFSSTILSQDTSLSMDSRTFFSEFDLLFQETATRMLNDLT